LPVREDGTGNPNDQDANDLYTGTAKAMTDVAAAFTAAHNHSLQAELAQTLANVSVAGAGIRTERKCSKPSA
jgi:hypothetical protein